MSLLHSASPVSLGPSIPGPSSTPPIAWNHIQMCMFYSSYNGYMRKTDNNQTITDIIRVIQHLYSKYIVTYMSPLQRTVKDNDDHWLVPLWPLCLSGLSVRLVAKHTVCVCVRITLFADMPLLPEAGLLCGAVHGERRDGHWIRKSLILPYTPALP